jgi:cytochrome c oxidase cbb3-type subunit 3
MTAGSTAAIFMFVVIVVAHSAWAQVEPASKKKASLEVTSRSAGQRTFASTCASCHGLDGKGGERGPDIVTSAEVTRVSDDELLSILRAGRPDKGMPPFAALGPATLASVLSYLRHLQGTGIATSVAGDTEKGKEIFRGQAHCADCHIVNGAGGFLGPDLSHYSEHHALSDIRAAIVSPPKQASKQWASADVRDKNGTVYEGLVRNEDNFSIQLQSSDGAFQLFSKSDLSAINHHENSLMPSDYGAKLSTAEIEDLVAYLVGTARQSPRR